MTSAANAGSSGSRHSGDEGLLGPDDPPAFTMRNPDGDAPAVIVCDHASNRIPSKLGSLGAMTTAMERHIAYDIGAKGVAEQLSDIIGAPAYFAGYSRLVIDINRPPDDFTSIREIYDRMVIAGNQGLSDTDRKRRAEEIFHPYHDAVATGLAEKRKHIAYPALISVHSCTDVYKGWSRPWHIGVLSNHDRRMAESVIAQLEGQNPDLTVGDNKPYSGLDAWGYTIETHALPEGLPNVLFEVRQDLIRDEDGQRRYAEILADALRPVMADETLYSQYDGG